MNASSPRLDYLDALRALLVFFVVCIHGLGYAALAPGPARSVVDFIVTPIAVQGFYLVDGALFARRLERGGIDGSRYLADSARRLLWPWLLFGIVYMATRYLAERQGLVEATALTQDDLSISAIAEMLWWSQVAPQLYFLPSLFLIRCAAIAGKRLLAYGAAATIVSGAALLLMFRMAIEPGYVRILPHDGLDPLLHALGGLGFFVLGAGLWRLRVIDRAHCLAAAAAASGIFALGLFGSQPIWGVAIQIGYLAALYFFFASGVLAFPVLAAIGRRTMGIYLLHMPIVMKICVLIAHRLVAPSGIAAYAIVVVTSFCIALAIAAFIAQARLSGVVFGERAVIGRAA